MLRLASVPRGARIRKIRIKPPSFPSRCFFFIGIYISLWGNLLNHCGQWCSLYVVIMMYCSYSISTVYEIHTIPVLYMLGSVTVLVSYHWTWVFMDFSLLQYLNLDKTTCVVSVAEGRDKMVLFDAVGMRTGSLTIMLMILR